MPQGDSAASFNTHFVIPPEALAEAREKGPTAAYEHLVESGMLRDSDQQRRVVNILSAIFHGLCSGRSADTASVRGLYIHGTVGSGKSMLMDLFHACVQQNLGSTKCRRMHFHEFSHMVHKMAHDAITEAPGVRPADYVSRKIAKDIGTLLCFDEMAITTIQDCCLLAPVFSAMWDAGVVTVLTSNRAPEDLYTGGLNRHVHLPPLLSALHRRCSVVPLVSEVDYRLDQVTRGGLSEDRVFSETAAAGFADGWWEKVTGGANRQSTPFSAGYGRTLQVVSHDGVALTSFDEMCRKSRSVEDYNALCGQFHTVIVDGIPVLDADKHNEARRFTNLIDAAYEAHSRLIAGFDAPLEEVLTGLTALMDVDVDEVGHSPGCGDGDTSTSTSAVLEAVTRMKAATENGIPKEKVMSDVFPGRPDTLGGARAVLAADAGPTPDMQIWKQGGDEEGSGGDAPPQVSKGWDDQRRNTQFSWECDDPTAEQPTVKGVFAAAVASLKETGFASARTHSRLMEMQSKFYLEEWAVKRGLRQQACSSISE